MVQDHTAAQTREEERKRLEEEKKWLEEEEERNRKEEEARLNQVLEFIEEVGYPTLSTFITTLITTKDPVRSSQVSRMFIRHSHAIFDGIRQRQPDVANDWAISTACQLITADGDRLAQRFKTRAKKTCFENPEAVLHGQFSLTSRGSRTINLPTTTSDRVL